MHHPAQANVDARGLRIGIAVSRYHPEITDSMCHAAKDAFRQAGGREDDLTIVHAAGAFELTAVCSALAAMPEVSGRRQHDALVALGCVITGETTHDQYIAQSVTQGLTSIIVATGVPIAFGVLTCNSLEQALQRSVSAQRAGGMNKGAEAMIAAIQTARALETLGTGKAARSR
jgi:6,7-dimethyl-8-ribityllumazine synthase